MDQQHLVLKDEHKTIYGNRKTMCLEQNIASNKVI